jgi:hypothetical protein
VEAAAVAQGSEDAKVGIGSGGRGAIIIMASTRFFGDPDQITLTFATSEAPHCFVASKLESCEP